MKKVRLLSLILCIIFLILTFTACYSSVDPAYIDADDGEPLMIYIWERDEFIKHHIDQYNSQHDEMQIEYEAFNDNQLSFMCKKIKKGIKELNGPDLILVDTIFLSYSDVCEMTKDGMFADMDKLISKSNIFDSSQYNMKVLDAGIINDTRVIVPVSYSIEAVIALKKSFDDLGLELPTELTIDSLLELLNKYYESVPEHSIPLNFIDLEFSLLSYINENHQIGDIKGVDELINFASINRERRNSSGYFIESQKEDFDWWEWQFDHDILFTSCGGNLSSLYYYYNILNHKYNSDIVLCNFPLGVENTKTYPFHSFAINATSNKKNRAFRFIEYMLSDEAQSDEEYYPPIPVNLDSYDLVKQRLLNGDYDEVIEKNIPQTPVPPELVFQYIDMIENADCEIKNYYYIFDKCIREPLSKYTSNRLQLDGLVDEINDNLYKYYNGEEE